MTSAEGSLPVIVVLVIVLCAPALLSLRACLKRVGYLRSNGRPHLWSQLGAFFSGATLVLNLWLTLGFFRKTPNGEIALGQAHAVGFTLSWACFCLWVFMIIAFHHRRKVH